MYNGVFLFIINQRIYEWINAHLTVEFWKTNNTVLLVL